MLYQQSTYTEYVRYISQKSYSPVPDYQSFTYNPRVRIALAYQVSKWREPYASRVPG